MRASSIHSCLRNLNRRFAQSLLAVPKHAASAGPAKIPPHSPRHSSLQA
jgi:hypothetical protein